MIHPMQSWAWGEFRKSSRVKVVRLKEGFQISFHKIPKLPWTIGYCPKSKIPSAQDLKVVKKEAVKQKAVMVKFEPNVRVDSKVLDNSGHSEPGEESRRKPHFFLRFARSFAELRMTKEKGLVTGLVRGRPLFTKYSFWLDLTKSEEELLAGMKSKTRYNVRLAEKKGVKVVEDSSNKGFEDYWKLMKETTSRQAFYAHNKAYHQKMWREMKKAGQAHLFKAMYKGEVLAVWIVFILDKVLYYPYGASSRKYRELMANNLLAWEVIKFGKKKGCKLFDMWGSLGKDPSKKDPWYGFHKFKEGYGGELVEFVGSWDLVVSPVLYWLYRLGENVRWVILRWRT